MSAPHVPVLLDEVMAAVDPQPGDRIIDGTYGAGGYAHAALERGAEVIGFDRDPDAVKNAERHPHLRIVHDDFSNLDSEGPADGVMLDIGVSSMQLDQAARGFSFQSDGPLDMRMAQSGESAADFVNTADETTIADVIYRYGEETQSRRIARAIVAARPVETTLQLANIVRKAIGQKPGAKKDAATKTFQGLRIHINRELDELEQGLAAAERALKPGGRLAVVTFHSLEDRIVKSFLRRRSGGAPAASRHLPERSDGPPPSFEAVGKAVRAGVAEQERNPRAR
ncbi:MAG TPA: 16S rRNA (cytosine(1402)-N(4))-methyltransferase RsmH, partial [Sphingomonas sp.]|nr:16S rRNA (cytosine(1402)-N(4))-methyltransferase RsmH [Sphingomonas sp.]